MEALFGRLIDHGERDSEGASVSALQRTASLWAMHYGGEPYAPGWLSSDMLGAFGLAFNSTASDPSPAALTEISPVPSWEAVRALVSINKDLLIEDARWLPGLRRFLDADRVRSLLSDSFHDAARAC